MNTLDALNPQINFPIHPDDLSESERPIIEAMCRAICEVAERHPDMPIFYYEAPKGVDWRETPPSPLHSMESQGFPQKQRPQWSSYAGFALSMYRAHKAMLWMTSS